MPVPGADQGSERPLGDLAQTVSEQAVVLAREQVDLARREMMLKARQAGAGAAMVGGAAFLGALASGTGTAGLVLLLARRPGASAAALGVAGAYAGASALLAREGLARVRQAGSPLPEEEAPSGKQKPAKQAAKSVRKQAGRATPGSRQPTRSKQRPPSAAAKRPRPRPS